MWQHCQLFFFLNITVHLLEGGHGHGHGGDDSSAIIIWESRTGVKRRSFSAEGPPIWPIFKWCHDGRFFARMSGQSTLSVYETPSFGLLDKKSIKVAGMRDFSWSPTENVLGEQWVFPYLLYYNVQCYYTGPSTKNRQKGPKNRQDVKKSNCSLTPISPARTRPGYWVAEDKDVPARVTLIEVPSRNEVRVKNLFNVADCKMHWQKTGDYLCVKVDRYNKLRRDAKDHHDKYAGIYYNFEIFHMREKQVSRGVGLGVGGAGRRRIKRAGLPVKSLYKF